MRQKKVNKYDLSGDYGVGWTSNTNKEFYFDLEDYEKIKGYSWSESSGGYIRTSKNNEDIRMHRLVLMIDDPSAHVDHIGHNLKDNRKSKLRPTTCHNNTMNKKLLSNNTSGVTGVSWEDKSKKWHAYIWYNGKTIHLGRFNDFDKAVSARINAENYYFKDFSYRNSMNKYQEDTK